MEDIATRPEPPRPVIIKSVPPTKARYDKLSIVILPQEIRIMIFQGAVTNANTKDRHMSIFHVFNGIRIQESADPTLTNLIRSCKEAYNAIHSTIYQGVTFNVHCSHHEVTERLFPVCLHENYLTSIRLVWPFDEDSLPFLVAFLNSCTNCKALEELTLCFENNEYGACLMGNDFTVQSDLQADWNEIQLPVRIRFELADEPESYLVAVRAMEDVRQKAREEAEKRRGEKADE
ncbi:hypothetical protein CAC42_7477 [Sphaceloma murrayae]|uniref:Uncharacterized protein n=1 Tax=Sphaceloma murrayae TaxID=2082308 RepID=A0A2K1QXJ6_9PEZI|nr:hypothetical protein CAC42_7477 [Sphaceloma murrayae]